MFTASPYQNEREPQEALRTIAKNIGGRRTEVRYVEPGKQPCADTSTGKIYIPRTATALFDHEALMKLRLFIYHEAGHIAETKTPKNKLNPAQAAIRNAVEDWRMEKVISERYPGAAMVLRWGQEFYCREVGKNVNEVTAQGKDVSLWESLCAMSFRLSGLQPAWTLTPKAQKYMDAGYAEFAKILTAKGYKDTEKVTEAVYQALVKAGMNEAKPKPPPKPKPPKPQPQQKPQQAEQDDDGEPQSGAGGEPQPQDGDSEEAEPQAGQSASGEEPEQDDKEAKDDKAEPQAGGTGEDEEDEDEGEDDKPAGATGGKADEDEEDEEDGEAGDKPAKGNGKDDGKEEADKDAGAGKGADKDEDEDTEAGNEADKNKAASGNDETDEDEDEDLKDAEAAQPKAGAEGTEDDEAGEGEEAAEAGAGGTNGKVEGPAPSKSDDQGEEAEAEGDQPATGGEAEDVPGAEPEQDEAETEEALREAIERVLTQQAQAEVRETAGKGQMIADALKQVIDALSPAEQDYTSLRENDQHLTDDALLKNPALPAAYDKERQQVAGDITGMGRHLEQALLAMAQGDTRRLLDRGRFDRRRMVQAGANLSRRVFTRTTKGLELDVAVEIILDESGSMGEYREIRLLAIALAETLQRLDIPFEITGTTTQFDYGNTPPLDGFTRTNPMVYHHFKWFSEAWSVVKGRILASSSLKHNIDGEAVRWCAQRLMERKEARKVIFSLSDGQPCGGQNTDKELGKNLQRVCDQCRRAGVEVFGFGVHTDAPKAYYRKEFFLNLPKPGQMGQDFMRAFARILTEGRVKVGTGYKAA